MAFEGEKDTDSPAADNAPAAALTDDQLERQLPPPAGQLHSVLVHAAAATHCSAPCALHRRRPSSSLVNHL
jgi:hypothetical protein